MRTHHIIASLLFFLLLGGVLLAIQTLLDKGVRQSSYAQFGKVNLVASHGIDPQVAIFGSSVSEVGVNPTQLHDSTGLDAYNLSIDGTRFSQLEGLIREFSAHTKRCKLVIMTEYFFTFQPMDRINEAERFMAWIENDNIYRSMYAVQPDLAFKMRYVPFYRYIVMSHAYYKASVFGWMGWSRHKSLLEPQLGYTPKDLPWDANLDRTLASAPHIQIVIDSAIRESYGRLLKEIVASGKQVLILLPPVQVDGRGLVDGLSELRETLSSFRMEGVHFLDLSDVPLTNDKTKFYNYSHLNREGSAILTKILAGEIRGIMGE